MIGDAADDQQQFISALTAARPRSGFRAFNGLATGIMIISLQNSQPLIFTNNTINAMPYGMILYNTETTGPVVIDNTNTISNNGVGIYLTDIVGFNPKGTTILGGAANNPTGTAHATLDGQTAAKFFGNTTSVLVRGTNVNVPNGAVLTLANGPIFTGGTTGLQLDGPHASLAGGAGDDAIRRPERPIHHASERRHGQFGDPRHGGDV